MSHLPTLTLIAPDVVAETFFVEDGFHRARWDVAGEWIQSNIPPDKLEAAWIEAAWVWVNLLRNDLGGSYRAVQSRQTILLCAEPEETVRWLGEFGDRADGIIKKYLGDTAWKGGVGKNVLLVFSDQQEYYRYISHHSSDGEQAATSGMCIYSGYTHVAFPWVYQAEAAYVIMHELAHAAVAHLALPRWLNEGIALTMENIVTSQRDFIFSAEELERHFAFWNEENIQEFWSGISFYQPGDASELSYNLALILMKFLSEKATPEKFRAFVEGAHWQDAGQEAAKGALNFDLGELSGIFLGPGNWRPNPAVMETHWG